MCRAVSRITDWWRTRYGPFILLQPEPKARAVTNKRSVSGPSEVRNSDTAIHTSYYYFYFIENIRKQTSSIVYKTKWTLFTCNCLAFVLNNMFCWYFTSFTFCLVISNLFTFVCGTWKLKIQIIFFWSGCITVTARAVSNLGL